MSQASLARARPRVRARGVYSAYALALAAGVLGAPAPVAAQATDRVVWVYLDAAAFPANAPPALGPAALARRARQGIPLYPNDAPIPDTLVAVLQHAGLDVRHRSRWLRAVSGGATPAALERIRGLEFVARVAPVGSMSTPRPLPESPDAAFVAPATPPPAFYGVAFEQVDQIGVPIAHDLGFSGDDVVVALLDTGFEQDHESLVGLNVIAAYDFIQGDTIVANQPGDPGGQSNHGTRVWSILGGHAPDRFVGPAFGAEFLLAKVDHLTLEPRADEDRWVAAIEWADSMGAQVVSSSLGYRCFDDGFCWNDDDLDGDTAPSTIAADAAAARGILVVNAAGNEGATTLIAPADADSIIAVGAVDANGSLASFSSTGPTGDGRIKPDLVARGVATRSASTSSSSGYIAGDGTSFATPLIGGGAALFMEAWPELSAMAALRALVLSGSIQPPSQTMGHGLPDVASAILFPQGIAPLPTPGTGAGQQVSTLAPTFSWSVPLLHPAARPVRYILEVATDPDFNEVVHEDTTIDAQVLTLSSPLAAADQLWWRVVAEAAPGVVRASEGEGPFTMPPWVELVSLNDPDNPFVTDPTPFLVWDPLPAPPPIGPLDYDIEIVNAANGDVFQLIAGVSDTTVSVVEPLPFNIPFRWRVIVRTAEGSVDTAQSDAPFVVVSNTAPPATLLYQNFPNPFPRAGQSTTTVWFDLDQVTRVSLSVYDIRGRLVRRLIPDARQGCGAARIQLDAGAYGRDGDPECVETEWDGRTDEGELMPPGVYVIRLITDRKTDAIRTLFRP